MADILVKQVEIKMKSGDVIFKEGDTGDKMFIIRSGIVEISKIIMHERLVLDILHNGEFFGEMSLFGSSQRTATAIAKEDCTLIVITKNMLNTQLNRVPEWFLIMFKALIERLRKTDTLLKERIEEKKIDSADKSKQQKSEKKEEKK